MDIIKPIVKAVSNGNIVKAKHLVQEIDVNALNQHGYTPLMGVSWFIDRGEEVQTLIKVADLLLT